MREVGLARLVSSWGELVARVRHGGGIARDSVFVPIHWNGQNASEARVGALVNPVVDPLSGEPEFKHTPVRIEDFGVAWYGFLLTRQARPLAEVTHWTRIQGQQCLRYEVAGRTPAAQRNAWARDWLGLAAPQADWLEYEDAAAGVYRAAQLLDDRLEACVFMSARPDLPARAWLASLFAQPRLSETERAGLLAGQPAQAGADVGAIVCSCFGVGRNTICAAIEKHGLQSPAEITACVKAGGNCGSCGPELKRLLAESATVPAS